MYVLFPLLSEFARLIFNDYFKQDNALHKHNTRNSTKLHMSYTRTNYRTYTIFHKGVLIWNVLNEE